MLETETELKDEGPKLETEAKGPTESEQAMGYPLLLIKFVKLEGLVDGLGRRKR